MGGCNAYECTRLTEADFIDYWLLGDFLVVPNDFSPDVNLLGNLASRKMPLALQEDSETSAICRSWTFDTCVGTYSVGEPNGPRTETRWISKNLSRLTAVQ